MGHIGGTTVDEFERICFKHKIPGILGPVLFQAQLDLRRSLHQGELHMVEDTQASIAKDQAVVHIPDVPDEEVVWFVRTSLKLMDQICSLMDTTIKHKAGDNGLPIGLPRN